MFEIGQPSIQSNVPSVPETPALNGIRDRIEAASNLLSVLESKLAPVLSQPPPQSESGGQLTANQPTALVEIQVRLERLCNQIGALVSRVQL